MTIHNFVSFAEKRRLDTLRDKKALVILSSKMNELRLNFATEDEIKAEKEKKNDSHD